MIRQLCRNSHIFFATQGEHDLAITFMRSLHPSLFLPRRKRHLGGFSSWATLQQYAPLDKRIGSAFIPWVGESPDDILCQQDERTVSADNGISFEAIKLQIPANQYQCHYVKATVRVHQYLDGSLAEALIYPYKKD
jgi:hypothetical protein